MLAKIKKMFHVDGEKKKKCIFAASNQGLLAQWFRALLSHGRGHRFNSYTTHKKKEACKVSFFFNYR